MNLQQRHLKECGSVTATKQDLGEWIERHAEKECGKEYSRIIKIGKAYV